MKLSRREFLKVAGFGVAGAALAPTLPGTGLAPAVQGPTFPAPTGIGTRTSPSVVEVALQAEEGWVPVAGRSARLWTYNGRYPGPTLKLREGDHVRLEFTNYVVCYLKSTPE